MSLKDAKASGYTPCLVCRPPVSEAAYSRVVAGPGREQRHKSIIFRVAQSESVVPMRDRKRGRLPTGFSNLPAGCL